MSLLTLLSVPPFACPIFENAERSIKLRGVIRVNRDQDCAFVNFLLQPRSGMFRNSDASQRARAARKGRHHDCERRGPFCRAGGDGPAERCRDLVELVACLGGAERGGLGADQLRRDCPPGGRPLLRPSDHGGEERTIGR